MNYKQAHHEGQAHLATFEATRADRAPVGRKRTAALALVLTACAGGGGTAAPRGDVGEVSEFPAGSGRYFIEQAHEGGAASTIQLTGVSWGRLVQVAGLGAPLGGQEVLIPMFSEFVVSSDIQDDGFNYRLDTNPVTAQQSLVILRRVDDPDQPAFDQFFDLLAQASANLTPVTPLAGGGAGVFSMVPRNATIVLQFDDLIDPATIDKTTVRVLTGASPVQPFTARIVPDPNHGGLADHDGSPGPEFYSTRVLIDPTITEIESFSFVEPLPPNGLGFPASVSANISNLTVRIPTAINTAVGQNRLLANPTEHFLATAGNGAVDFGSSTQDVVRAMRAGGDAAVTSDPFNGFLRDEQAPLLVGSMPLTLRDAPEPLDPADPAALEFVLPRIEFADPFCAQTPEAGDVIAQADLGIFAEIIEQPLPVVGGELQMVRVRLIQFPVAWDDPDRRGTLEWADAGPNQTGELRAAFDPAGDAGREACFVTVVPVASGPTTNGPTSQIRTDSSMLLRFNEPISPSSVNAFDSVRLTRQPVPAAGEPPLATSAYVVGRVLQSVGGQSVTFQPDLDLAHEFGLAEDYFLTLAGGVGGPTDLAGNPLVATLPSVVLTISADEATQRTGGRVSRFTAQDEEPPIGGAGNDPLPEWGGQHLYDLQRELIRPRPVSRFQVVADGTQGITSLQDPFLQGVQTPLSNLGSKMQSLYRYADFGWSLTDTTNINVDVEGISWTPLGGVIFDSYDEFSISLAHSRWAPDAWKNPDSFFPDVERSGLRPVFDNNLLNAESDPLRVVHGRELGYVVNPGDQFLTATNTLMMPYPLNRDVAPEDRQYYTWRDTSLPDRAGANSNGVPPRQQLVALGLDALSTPLYRSNRIATIGLPLLMEFRCYPDDAASGQNGFNVNLAVNTSSRPYFRAFSTGGINSSGNTVIVDPDLENGANGGFNPVSQPTTGAATFGRDNTVYLGALDIVVRVSRSVSVWFPATDPQTGEPFAAPTYAAAVIEPRVEDQPLGTSLSIDFRGASAIEPFLAPGTETAIDPHPALVNANRIDIYGDFYWDQAPPMSTEPFFPEHNPADANLDITFLDGDEEWKSDISELNTARYYQMRLTFVAEEQSGLVPEVSAVALAWEE